MKHRILSLLSGFLTGIFFIFSSHLWAQTVEVSDLTLKVGAMATEEVYFGFAEGDEIVFSFDELKGKELKEIEITELPGNSKFMDFKTQRVDNKKIKVNKEAVYRFSFRNTAMAGRICKIHIQRIPASPEMASYNTDWQWKTIFDTTFTPYVQDSLTGYDTLRYKETVKELVSSKKIEEMIQDKTQRVHSYYNSNPSKTYLRIDLPGSKTSAYRQEKTIAWAYWIGVGPEAAEAFAQNVKNIGGIAGEAATVMFSPLAGLAVGLVTELITPRIGEDVYYSFVSSIENARAFASGNSYYQFDEGKGIAAYGKRSDRLVGTHYLCLHNDNNHVGIDVNVKIVVIREVKIWDDIEYD